MAFTHLHVHTQYSLLDGSCKIKELCSRAKELGMDSLAITDHGVMYGCVEFYKAAREAGIKPILGCEIYVAPGSRFERDARPSEERYYHMVLLAENEIGYHNLVKIVSRGFTEGFYYRPRVDAEVLEEFHEGIIALSACLAGEIPMLIRKGQYDKACEAALKYENIFGKGNFFLELQDHGLPEQQTVNAALLRMHKELGINLAATNDVHYINAEDAEPHDILLCIQTGKKVSDEDRMHYYGGQFYLKSEDEMRRLFPYAAEAVDNTAKIAERCNVEFEFHKTKLPHYDVPFGMTSWEYLNKKCFEGLAERYSKQFPGGADQVSAEIDKAKGEYAAEGDTRESLAERMKFELSVIKDMGFTDYFLIVWDFINYARSKNIMVGPGRGSGAGSIVAYSMGITNIDPIRYKLLFERFLNPERVSMPDIDVDFCYERRHEVIEYVVDKYGKDRVSQIITFNTMAAKAVIRDVGRVMDYPYNFCDMIAKAIPALPNGQTITIKVALEMNPELRSLYHEDDKARRLMDMAMKLEGLPRNSSVHPAGVVIGPSPIEEFVPLAKAQDGGVTTQYEAATIEELGLLKMDFLGLRTLTVIRDAVDMANRLRAGKGETPIDIKDINMDDQKVFGLIASGKTEGVFQLESPGMTRFMKELKPSSLEDLIAGIALYRPGPMDFIPQYIKGKNDPEHIEYMTPELEPILKTTYGCIVYQEQVMQIVRDLGGYTLGRSDLVRRAMSKKKKSVIEGERKNFVYGNEAEGIPGCISRGVSKEAAEKVFDAMMDFANYAFNKSHAAAYAVVAYQTAWLKCYYPVEFMASTLTSVMDKNVKLVKYFLACKNMGIDILPPDINKGFSSFTVSDGAIVYGLAAAKSIGKSVVDAVVAEREKAGPYESLKDFIYRLSNREVNHKTLESFIKSGAMDCLPGTRKQKLVVCDEIISMKTNEQRRNVVGQMSLFAAMNPDGSDDIDVNMPDVGEFSKEELLAYEKEVVGMYISGHPMDEFENVWRRGITNISADFIYDEGAMRAEVSDKARVTIGGMITNVVKKTTKNNKLMAYVTIEDLYGSVDVTIFPRDYDRNRDLLREEMKVFVRGRVQYSDGDNAKMILESAWEMKKSGANEAEKTSSKESYAPLPRELWLQFADKAEFDRKKNVIMDILINHMGQSPVNIYLRKEKAMKVMPSGYRVDLSDELLEELVDNLGDANVRVTEGRKR